MSAKTTPAKPYPEFPLWAHQNGQWCRKIRGKAHYFGLWESPELALQRYLDEIDDIQAGRNPRSKTTTPELISVAEALNLYLSAADAKREAAR